MSDELPPLDRFYGRWHGWLLVSLAATLWVTAFVAVTVSAWFLLLLAVAWTQGALVGFALGCYDQRRPGASPVPSAVPPPLNPTPAPEDRP